AWPARPSTSISPRARASSIRCRSIAWPARPSTDVDVDVDVARSSVSVDRLAGKAVDDRHQEGLARQSYVSVDRLAGKAVDTRVRELGVRPNSACRSIAW